MFAVGVTAIWLAVFVAAQTQPGVDMGSTQGHTLPTNLLT